jgi:hypothetical protein
MIAGAVVCLIVALSITSAATSGGDKPPTGEPGSYPDTWKCIDPTPKKDGACRVSGGGFLDTGLSTGWIRSDGPRPGHATCAWRRLSGPSTSLEFVIGIGTEKSGPVLVELKPGDYAFWSEGCQPWQHMG